MISPIAGDTLYSPQTPFIPESRATCETDIFTITDASQTLRWQFEGYCSIQRRCLCNLKIINVEKGKKRRKKEERKNHETFHENGKTAKNCKKKEKRRLQMKSAGINKLTHHFTLFVRAYSFNNFQ